MGVLQLIWLYEIIGGMILMCQNTTMRVYGARIKRYRVLCSNHIAARSSLVITSCWFATSRLRVPASVRRVYNIHMVKLAINRSIVMLHLSSVPFAIMSCNGNEDFIYVKTILQVKCSFTISFVCANVKDHITHLKIKYIIIIIFIKNTTKS